MSCSPRPTLDADVGQCREPGQHAPLLSVADQIHNPSSYVRDFYFFKRSQYPQLELVHMKPDEAFSALQQQELMHKFVEIGKVLLTWAILKNVDMVVQRVVFLHEELMKLPSFPRKALEADLDLYKGGEIGKVCVASIVVSFLASPIRKMSNWVNFELDSAGAAWFGRAAQVHVGAADRADVRGYGR